MRKLCFLFTSMIFTLAITFLPPLGSFPANATHKVLPSLTDEWRLRPSTLITFTPVATGFLPIIMNPPGPPSVNLVSSSVYTDSFGTLYVVGEVINNTPSNVRFVRVTVTLHNSAGNIVRSDYAYTLIDILAPSQKAPFKVYFANYPPEYTTYQPSITYSTTTQLAKSGLPVLNSRTWSSGLGTLYTVGEVQNNTSSNIELIKAVATYYDTAGIVVNTDYTYVQISILSPSQKGPFKIFTSDRPYNSYNFSVDYNVTEELPISGASITNLDIWTELGATFFTGEIANDSGGNIQFIQAISC